MIERLTVDQIMTLVENNSERKDSLQEFVNGNTLIEKAEVQISFDNGNYGYIPLDLSQLVTAKFLERAAKQQVEKLKETNDLYKQELKERIEKL